MVRVLHTDSRFDVENGSTVIIYRRGIVSCAPNAIGLIRLQTGIGLDIKPGYCGIVSPINNLHKTGLICTNSPIIILPGNTREIELHMWKSQLPYFTEGSSYETPYDQNDMIGFIQIVKCPKE
ncbi:MAG: hypothetical protein ABFD50_16860 [Smithella sp.]